MLQALLRGIPHQPLGDGRAAQWETVTGIEKGEEKRELPCGCHFQASERLSLEGLKKHHLIVKGLFRPCREGGRLSPKVGGILLHWRFLSLNWTVIGRGIL